MLMSEPKYLTTRLRYPGSPRIALSNHLMMPQCHWILPLAAVMYLWICRDPQSAGRTKKPLSQVQQFMGTSYPFLSCPSNLTHCLLYTGVQCWPLPRSWLIASLALGACSEPWTLLSRQLACAFSFGSHTIRATFVVKNCRWFGPVELSIFVCL